MHVEAVFFGDSCKFLKIFFSYRLDAHFLPPWNFAHSRFKKRTRARKRMALSRSSLFLLVRWNDDNIVQLPMILWCDLLCVRGTDHVSFSSEHRDEAAEDTTACRTGAKTSENADIAS